MSTLTLREQKREIYKQPDKARAARLARENLERLKAFAKVPASERPSKADALTRNYEPVPLCTSLLDLTSTRDLGEVADDGAKNVLTDRSRPTQ